VEKCKECDCTIIARCPRCGQCPGCGSCSCDDDFDADELGLDPEEEYDA